MVIGSNGTLRKTIGATATLTIGMAINVTGTTTQNPNLVDFQDLGTSQMLVRYNPDGTLSVVRGGTTVLATTTAALSQGVYAYLEFRVLFLGGSAGTYELRLNGVAAASGSSVTTIATGNASANSVVVGQTPGPDIGLHIDDVYIANGLGSVNTGFLGDVMIQVLRPNGAGATTNWLPSAGSNYQNVSELLQDGDGTFNSSATTGDVDLYAMEDLSAAPLSIKGIQWVGWLKKTDGSSYVLHREVRSGGTNYEGSVSFTPNTGYSGSAEIIELDPATGVAWTQAGINAMQAGVKLVSVA